MKIDSFERVYVEAHMPIETFLIGIIPAIGFPGHGLPKFIVLNQLDELQALVVRTLVAVDECFCMKRYPMPR